MVEINESFGPCIVTFLFFANEYVYRIYQRYKWRQESLYAPQRKKNIRFALFETNYRNYSIS